jgi:hypothetical protein
VLAFCDIKYLGGVIFIFLIFKLPRNFVEERRKDGGQSQSLEPELSGLI